MTPNEIRSFEVARTRLRESIVRAQRGEKQAGIPNETYEAAQLNAKLPALESSARDRVLFVLRQSDKRDRQASWDCGRFQTHLLGEVRNNQTTYQIGRKLLLVEEGL